jgi:signal transduction histidine kinase
MVTIRFRLITLFVFLVTVTLTGFGVYGQARLSQQLEQQFADRQKETLFRLQTSLPAALWNYDKDQSGHIILAELEADEVESVTVFDSKGSVFLSLKGKGRLATQRTTAISTDVIKSEATLWPPSGAEPVHAPGDQATAIGRVAVSFARDHITQGLRSALTTRLVEIVVLDVLLIIALTVSLNMVFRPIERLRDALWDLAEQEGDEARELPEITDNEFGEVVRAFNQTQRKLRHIIARRTLAEEASRVAAVKTDVAYRDLQSAQESLVQAEKLAGLGSLVAGVAHEINTPIGIVLTSATLLGAATAQTQQSLAGGGLRKSEVVSYMETAAESARLITSNAERAAHLIQSFKQVAVDQTSDQRRQFKLSEYLSEVTTSLLPSLRKSHAVVTVECDDALVMDSYPGLLAQVLTNLTVNSLVHAFDGRADGEIRIQVAAQAQSVTIAFSDNGHGIPEDHIGRIFDPFFTTRRGNGGTGLGLNIVFNIVTKQLGGTIAIHNLANAGACFTICIPRVTPHSATD